MDNELGIVSRDCWDADGTLRNRAEIQPWNTPRSDTQAQVVGNTLGLAPTNFQVAYNAVRSLFMTYTDPDVNYLGDVPYHFFTSQSGHIFEGRACSFGTDQGVCPEGNSK